MKQESTKVTLALEGLQTRLNRVLQDRTVQSWAGCCSEDTPDGEPENSTAYVFEPRISARNSREIRALVLAVTLHGVPVALWPLLVHLQERISKKREPVFEKLNLSIQFLLDGALDRETAREAVLKLLRYTPRSWKGNDEELALQVLRRSELRIRALQRSKASRSSLKRPKERAEPTHEWLPGWQHQFQSCPGTDWSEEINFVELLSPSEILCHLARD